MCIRGGQRGGPCLNRFLLNAFHFGDLERFGNRLATLGTKVVRFQTEGTRQNGALDQKAGATSQNISLRQVKGQCVTAIIVNADVKIKLKNTDPKMGFLRNEKRAPKMIFTNVIFGGVAGK